MRRSVFRPSRLAVLAVLSFAAGAMTDAPRATALPDLRRPAPASVARATVIVRAPVTSATAIVGDEIRVELVACAASCGYTWRVTSWPAATVARYVSTTYRRSRASEGLVGGNDIEDVTFHAVGPGSTSIVLGYFPPGRDRTPRKSYLLHLRVDCPATSCPAPRSGEQQPR